MTVAPGFERPPHDLRTPAVDADVDAERGERRHDGGEALPLHRPIDDRGDIGGALTAEVERVGAVGQQLPGPRHGGVGRGGDRSLVQRVGAGVDHAVEEHRGPTLPSAH